MYISRFRLYNYKSFLDSEGIEFNKGINLIVGQNNSGKTALLEGLNLNFENNPHLSLKTLSERTSIIVNQNSNFEIELTLTKAEIRKFLLREQEQSKKIGIFLPRGIDYELSLEESQGHQGEIIVELATDCVNKFNQWLDSENVFTLTINKNQICEPLKISDKENFYLYSPDLPDSKDLYKFIELRYNTTKEKYESIPIQSVSYDDEGNEEVYDESCRTFMDSASECLYFKLFNNFKKNIYRFQAGASQFRQYTGEASSCGRERPRRARIKM